MRGAIWVVVDRLSKVAHFLAVREDITASQLADLYISRILVLHGIPKKIISDRGSLFTSKFWTSFPGTSPTAESIAPVKT